MSCEWLSVNAKNVALWLALTLCALLVCTACSIENRETGKKTKVNL